LVTQRLSLLVFDDYFATFLFNLVKKLLGVAPDLSARSSFDELLHLLPVFSIKAKSYKTNTVRNENENENEGQSMA